MMAKCSLLVNQIGYIGYLPFSSSTAASRPFSLNQDWVSSSQRTPLM
ncbi:MAG: hypothetical protein BWX73_00401 [Lentisphaerae bacterium ADurb.Bin082]|nr:MAG: hypothetical protein BWX73_00401 [Lentisphaerae bacterium ADurb.Bin082]